MQVNETQLVGWSGIIGCYRLVLSGEIGGVIGREGLAGSAGSTGPADMAKLLGRKSSFLQRNVALMRQRLLRSNQVSTRAMGAGFPARGPGVRGFGLLGFWLRVLGEGEPYVEGRPASDLTRGDASRLRWSSRSLISGVRWIWSARMRSRGGS